MITARQIREVISLLRSIDRDEFGAAGSGLTDPEWTAFNRDPFNFFLRAPDALQEAITSIINGRIRANA